MRRDFSASSSSGSGSTGSGSSNPPSSNHPSSFSTDRELAGLFKNPIVQQLWKARQEAKRRQKKKKDPTTARTTTTNNTLTKQTEGKTATIPGKLKGKAPSDSRVQVTYQFETDVHLLEAYRNPWGQIRLGRLMEDLDALAGNIAFFHVDSDNEVEDNDDDTNQAQQHPVIVTASVDRIRLKHRPPMGPNQHLSGQVTWTGTSSMEIKMQCATCGDPDDEEPWLEAYVTFVTLHPDTKKPMPIPPVLPETPQEHLDYAAGARRAQAKKDKRQSLKGNSSGSGSSSYHAELESLAASLLAEAGPLLTMPSLADPHAILMHQTKMQNALIAQPQTQNLHNRIFGGYLVRRAFELSFANAYLFGGALPIFLEVDEISFWSPVDVGDLLVFNSRVLYTDKGQLSDYYSYDHHHHHNHSPNTSSAASSGKDHEPRNDELVSVVHVEVEAWVTEPEKAKARLSNQFYFTFAVPKPTSAASAEDDDGVKAPPRPPVRQVLPSNNDEARRMAGRILGDRDQHQHDRDG